ncbi:Pre-mRNA cleavage complex 2 protein Pcf11 [Liparis tanakae]|uniref:Pre-mRNA cleavage complex 2 protein Pcf11 n=1 Tax=Liparis tanakae TaxID=230148 RepID=A0A4Z2G5T6_9TELE|nr:Pre-mRNA cleavage complex 2 protein Pcf11 [Liparis tanakae]
MADLEERAKSNFFEKESEDEVQKSQQAAKEKEVQSVRATKDQVGETSSYLDATPSPSKLLDDHPLGAFVKSEEEEETASTSCAVAAAIKQEVESGASELPEVKKEPEEVLTDCCRSNE